MSHQPIDSIEPPENLISPRSPESSISEREATEPSSPNYEPSFSPSSSEPATSPPASPAPSKTDTFCICHSTQQSVDLETVISCSNRECTYPLHHLQCVGLVDHLPARLTWFCPECRKMDRLVCRYNGVSMAKGAKGVTAYVRTLDTGTKRDVRRSMGKRPREFDHGKAERVRREGEVKGVKRKRDGGAAGERQEGGFDNMRGRHHDNAMQVDDSSADDKAVVEPRPAKRRNFSGLRERRPLPLDGQKDVDTTVWHYPAWRSSSGQRIAMTNIEEDPISPRTIPFDPRRDTDPDPAMAALDALLWPRTHQPGPRIATPDREEEPQFPRGKVVVARDNVEPERTHDTPMQASMDVDDDMSSSGGEQESDEGSGLSFRLRGMEHCVHMTPRSDSEQD